MKIVHYYKLYEKENTLESILLQYISICVWFCDIFMYIERICIIDMNSMKGYIIN